MNRVLQTRFGDKQGNCLQAALASLFELPLDACPHVFENGPRDWQKRLDVWLRQFGLYHVIVDLRRDPFMPVSFPAIFSGKSPRGDFLHVVIGKLSDTGQFHLLHDPHPSQAGIESFHDVMFFIPTEPHFLVASEAQRNLHGLMDLTDSQRERLGKQAQTIASYFDAVNRAGYDSVDGARAVDKMAADLKAARAENERLREAVRRLCRRMEINELVNKPDNPCNHYDQPDYDFALAALKGGAA